MIQARFRHTRNRAVIFYNQKTDNMKKSNRKKTEAYILFSCNAWHEYNSFERKAVFSSVDKAVEFLVRNRKRLKLEETDIECFKEYYQTQGRNTNYLIQPCPFDPVTIREIES